MGKILRENQGSSIAFTLAEVLITLGIIGVVAAMTIPSLIQGQQEKAIVAALKKTFSTLSNAYTLAVQENGTPDAWGFNTSNGLAGRAPTLDKLKPYLSVIKDCTDGSAGCWTTGVGYRYLKPTGNDSPYDSNTNYPKLKLADGTLLFGLVDSVDCTTQRGNSLALQNVCAHIFVDVNGYNKPNQWGKDTFEFYITKYGIVPLGSSLETISTTTFTDDCKDASTAVGEGCAAWVIYNENLDYLHCTGLDWATKTKCN